VGTAAWAVQPAQPGFSGAAVAGQLGAALPT